MGDSSSPALPLLPPTLGSPPSAGPSLTDRPLSSGLSSSQKAGLQRAPPSGTSHKHKPGCELQGGSWALPASGEQSAPPTPPHLRKWEWGALPARWSKWQLEATALSGESLLCVPTHCRRCEICSQEEQDLGGRGAQGQQTTPTD